MGGGDYLSLQSMLVRTEMYRQFLTTQRHTSANPPPPLMLLCWIGPVPTLFPLSPDIVSLFMASSRHSKKGMLYKCLQPWLGDGLLLSSGEKWSMRRKQLTPAFHHSATLQHSIPLFQRRAEELRQLLLSHADQTPPPAEQLRKLIAMRHPEGRELGPRGDALVSSRWRVALTGLANYIGFPSFKFVVRRSVREWRHLPGAIDVFPLIKACTLDIICDTAMGVSINALTGNACSAEGRRYAMQVQEMGKLTWDWMLRPYLYSMRLFHALSRPGKRHRECLAGLHGFTRSVIAQRKAERSAASPPCSRSNNFLDTLLQMQADGSVAITDEEIQEEVDTFMFEGHDTTGVSLGWTLYCLGRNVDVQLQLQRELDAVMGQCTVPEYEQLERMPYLQACISESLRLYPPVPMFSRTTTEPLTVGSVTIPRGMDVSISPWLLHRDSTVWDRPDEFLPERWLGEDSCSQRVHHFSYMPFAQGPRNCIGRMFALNEEKMLVATVAKQFVIAALHNLDEVQPSPEIILRPKSGVWVKLWKREPLAASS
jgi:cytochrome P450